MSNNQTVSFEHKIPDNLKGLVADWSSDVQTFGGLGGVRP